MRKRGLGLLALCALLFVLTSHATADPIVDGALLIIYPDTGTFDSLIRGGGSDVFSESTSYFPTVQIPTQNYIITRYTNSISGEFPAPAAMQINSDVQIYAGSVPGGVPGTEYFYIGFVDVQGPATEHMLHNAAGTPDELDNTLENGFIAGVQALLGGALAEGDQTTMSASDFFDLFVGESGFGATDYAEILDRGDSDLISFNMISALDEGGSGLDGLFGQQPFTLGTISTFLGQTGTMNPPGTNPGFVPIPEPGSLALIASGLFAAGVWRRRKRAG